jgi:hypothetical protein
MRMGALCVCGRSSGSVGNALFPWIASGSAPRVTPARLLAVALFAALH